MVNRLLSSHMPLLWSLSVYDIADATNMTLLTELADVHSVFHTASSISDFRQSPPPEGATPTRKNSLRAYAGPV